MCKIFFHAHQICLISIVRHKHLVRVYSFFQHHVSDFAWIDLHKSVHRSKLVFLDHEFCHGAMHLYFSSFNSAILRYKYPHTMGQDLCDFQNYLMVPILLHFTQFDRIFEYWIILVSLEYLNSFYYRNFEILHETNRLYLI